MAALGSIALKRGLPRTHYFAQARSVFAVAAHRCAELFNPPKSMTLWNLPAELEEAFDARWEHWLDDGEAWRPFFQQVEQMQGTDLIAALRGRASQLGRSRGAEHPAALCGGPGGAHSGNAPAERRGSTRLALGFAKGEPGLPRYPTHGSMTRTEPGARSDVVSSFTVIKGALIEETYAVLAAWDFGRTKRANLDAIKRENAVAANSETWLRDVAKVLNRRFDPAGRDRPLALLARAGMDLEHWKPLLLWHMTRDEFLLRDFLVNWLFPAWEAGTFRVRPEDLEGYLRKLPEHGGSDRARMERKPRSSGWPPGC